MRKLHVVEIARRERKREEGGRERVYLEWYSIILGMVLHNEVGRGWGERFSRPQPYPQVSGDTKDVLIINGIP